MKNDIKNQINKITEVAYRAYEVTEDTEDTIYNFLKQLRDELDCLLKLYYKDDKSKIKILNTLIGECEDSAFGDKYLCDFYTYYISIISSIQYCMNKFKKEVENAN